MRYIGLLLLVAIMALGTAFAGWYTIPVAGAAWAAIIRTQGAHWQAGFAALLAWGGWMAMMAVRPAFGSLLTHIGQLFTVPGIVVALVSLLLAFALAASAARLVLGIVGARVRTA